MSFSCLWHHSSWYFRLRSAPTQLGKKLPFLLDDNHFLVLGARLTLGKLVRMLNAGTDVNLKLQKVDYLIDH